MHACMHACMSEPSVSHPACNSHASCCRPLMPPPSHHLSNMPAPWQPEGHHQAHQPPPQQQEMHQHAGLPMFPLPGTLEGRCSPRQLNPAAPEFAPVMSTGSRRVSAVPEPEPAPAPAPAPGQGQQAATGPAAAPRGDTGMPSVTMPPVVSLAASPGLAGPPHAAITAGAPYSPSLHANVCPACPCPCYAPACPCPTPHPSRPCPCPALLCRSTPSTAASRRRWRGAPLCLPGTACTCTSPQAPWGSPLGSPWWWQRRWLNATRALRVGAVLGRAGLGRAARFAGGRCPASG